jgi:hypothetical protein
MITPTAIPSPISHLYFIIKLASIKPNSCCAITSVLIDKFGVGEKKGSLIGAVAI